MKDFLLANTLVLDTTNFTAKTQFRGSGENLHVIERFTRVDPSTVMCRFTVDDPSNLGSVVER